MDELTDLDEPPPEWAGRKPSSEIYYYHTEDPRKRQLNLERYLISYPWILRARDANGYLAYHCGLCNRHATVCHLLTSEHNRRAALRTPWAGSRTLPEWMMQWRAPSTDADGAGLFTQYQQNVWPFDPTDQHRRSAEFRCPECEHNIASPQSDCRTCRAGLEGGRRVAQLVPNDTHKHPRREKERVVPTPRPPSISGSGQPGVDRQGRQGVGEGETPPPLRRRVSSRDWRPLRRPDHDEQPDQSSDDERHRTCHEVTNIALITSAPRCKGEIYLHPTFACELERYTACQLRSFNVDHYFTYGPWPLDFGSWREFEEETMKEVQGTAALGVTLQRQRHYDAIDVTFNADNWNTRTVRIGDKIVISHSHPSLDAIVEATVTRARWGNITLEWKANWKRLEEYLPEQRSKCPFSPADLFRADIHIEDISPGRVRSTLDKLTCVYGEDRHDIAFITPLQAMITLRLNRGPRSSDFGV